MKKTVMIALIFLSAPAFAARSNSGAPDVFAPPAGTTPAARSPITLDARNCAVFAQSAELLLERSLGDFSAMISEFQTAKQAITADNRTPEGPSMDFVGSIYLADNYRYYAPGEDYHAPGTLTYSSKTTSFNFNNPLMPNEDYHSTVYYRTPAWRLSQLRDDQRALAELVRIGNSTARIQCLDQDKLKAVLDFANSDMNPGMVVDPH